MGTKNRRSSRSVDFHPPLTHLQPPGSAWRHSAAKRRKPISRQDNHFEPQGMQISIIVVRRACRPRSARRTGPKMGFPDVKRPQFGALGVTNCPVPIRPRSPRGRSSPPPRWRHTPSLAAVRELGLAWGGPISENGASAENARGMTRGSGRAGGDPGNGGLRTWSGRERSSHKHRLHVRGRTSPAHPGPCPDLTATARRPSPHIGPHLPSPRPDGACLVARAQATTTDPRDRRAVELYRRRPPLPPATLRGGRRPGPRRPVAPQRHPAEQGHPRLPVQRHPRASARRRSPASSPSA